MTMSQYEQSFRKRLGEFADGLAEDISGLHFLNKEIQEDVFRFLLKLACQSQGSEALRLGGQGIRALRPPWVLERIEAAAEVVLDLSDEYEYRRLLELAETLDDDLLKHLVKRGQESDDEELRETAEEFSEVRPRPRWEALSPTEELLRAYGIGAEPVDAKAVQQVGGGIT